MSGETKQRLSDLEVENAELRQRLLDRPTLRDQFAMAVLPTVASDYRYDPETSCKIAYDLADKMIEVRHAKD
jgi:hypothetical protein